MITTTDCVLGTCWKVALFMAYGTISMPSVTQHRTYSFKFVGNVAGVTGDMIQANIISGARYFVTA